MLILRNRGPAGECPDDGLESASSQSQILPGTQFRTGVRCSGKAISPKMQSRLHHCFTRHSLTSSQISFPPATPECFPAPGLQCRDKEQKRAASRNGTSRIFEGTEAEIGAAITNAFDGLGYHDMLFVPIDPTVPFTVPPGKVVTN